MNKNAIKRDGKVVLGVKMEREGAQLNGGELGQECFEQPRRALMERKRQFLSIHFIEYIFDYDCSR